MIYKPSTLILLTLILALVQPGELGAQDLDTRPLQKLIDCPSAGGPEYHSYDFELRTYADGGVLTGFTIGLFQRFSMGLFFGGTGIIGFGKPDWNPQPGVIAQYRFLNETTGLPALAIGFNNQGYGKWDDDAERYQFKAKGFYAVLGKNFVIGQLGEFGTHFGVNQNPVSGDDDRIDFWTAADYHLTTQLTVILEYSAALNDCNRKFSYGEGRGYMNAGIRWTFAERLAIDLHFRDVLNNQKDGFRGGSEIGREVRISYVESF